MDDRVIETLARNLSDAQVDALVSESAGLTSWVVEAVKRIQEAKYGQDC